MPLTRSRLAAPAAPAALGTLALIALAGCGEEPDPVVVPGGSVLALTPATITAVPGDTVRLRVTDRAGRSLRPTVLGVTSGVATVDPTGLVTAVAPGTAMVTLTVTANGGTTTASIPITVLGIVLEPARATIAVGATAPFTPTFVGEVARYGTIVWSSTDTSVITVGPEGRVRGVGPGIAQVVATASADPRLRAEGEVVSVCVCGTIQALTVEPAALALAPGGTQQIAAVVTLAPGAPAGTSLGVLYASSDTTVATVSATGLVTGRRVGAATLTVAAVATPGLTRTVPVTVR
jgi:uncharacterized protein YjdB